MCGLCPQLVYLNMDSALKQEIKSDYAHAGNMVINALSSECKRLVHLDLHSCGVSFDLLFHLTEASP